MGSIFSSSSSSDQHQPSELAIELRLALRAPEGPSTTSSSSTTPSDKKNDDNNQEEETSSSNNHRSVRVLKILNSPDFDPKKDLIMEHILEIVDNAWEENHPGAQKVLSKIIDELIADNETFLEKLIITCMLYQKCWLAMDMALKRLIQLVKKKNSNTSSSRMIIDSEHMSLFNIAVLETPLKLLTKVITELKWLAHHQQKDSSSAKTTMNLLPLFKSQFRLLTQRLAREHKPPKSEEQKKKTEIKKKQKSEYLRSLTEPDEEVSKQCLIEFLRVSGAADYLNAEQDIENEAMKIQTSEVVKEVLCVCTKPWSQLEATVGETPLSWTCSGCNKKQLVTQTALALQKKGLTFPAGARVLSYLACPCGNSSGEEEQPSEVEKK